MASSLSSGSRLPRASSMPACAAMVLRRGRVVAGQHDRRDTERLAARPPPARELSLMVSATAKMRQHAGFVGQQRHRAALLLVRAPAALRARGCTARAPRSGGGCRARGRAVDVALHAAAGQGLEVADRVAAPTCQAGDRLRHRVIGARGQARRQRPEPASSPTVEWHRLPTSLGLPSVMVPVLSSAMALQLACAPPGTRRP